MTTDINGIPLEISPFEAISLAVLVIFIIYHEWRHKDD